MVNESGQPDIWSVSAALWFVAHIFDKLSFSLAASIAAHTPVNFIYCCTSVIYLYHSLAPFPHSDVIYLLLISDLFYLPHTHAHAHSYVHTYTHRHIFLLIVSFFAHQSASSITFCTYFILFAAQLLHYCPMVLQAMATGRPPKSASGQSTHSLCVDVKPFDWIFSSGLAEKSLIEASLN